MATTLVSLHLIIAIFLALASLSSAAASISRSGHNMSSPSSSFSVIRLPTAEMEEVCSGSARPKSCPMKCFRADPVCGVNGVTYWCGCQDAECAGTKVAKLGFCEVGNDGAGPQALLLVHIVWLIVVGFSVLFGVF